MGLRPPTHICLLRFIFSVLLSLFPRCPVKYPSAALHPLPLPSQSETPSFPARPALAWPPPCCVTLAMCLPSLCPTCLICKVGRMTIITGEMEYVPSSCLAPDKPSKHVSCCCLSTEWQPPWGGVQVPAGRSRKEATGTLMLLRGGRSIVWLAGPHQGCSHLPLFGGTCVFRLSHAGLFFTLSVIRFGYLFFSDRQHFI